ncbi:hypothetical protein, partial [Citrobacter koseri]|uniref:hypothetical protein n=1 Tax=Citrobacter koseri TaxID=545 RepID=UPI0024B86A0B
IGASGLMETFLPSGGSDLAGNSWLSKLAGGLSGARPATPNKAAQSKATPPQPGGAGGAGGQGGAMGPDGQPIVVNYTNNQAT